MVVPVLITSCQVSENPKNGPLTSQTRITSTAKPNATELPVQTVDLRANRSITPGRCGIDSSVSYAPGLTCWTISRQAFAQARHSLAQLAMTSSLADCSHAAAQSSQHFAQQLHAWLTSGLWRAEKEAAN
jgi:hypothetical protein